MNEELLKQITEDVRSRVCPGRYIGLSINVNGYEELSVDYSVFFDGEVFSGGSLVEIEAKIVADKNKSKEDRILHVAKQAAAIGYELVKKDPTW